MEFHVLSPVERRLCEAALTRSLAIPEGCAHRPVPERVGRIFALVYRYRAPLSGKYPIPPEKAAKFRFEPDKFRAPGFTRVRSEWVLAPRVLECPVQLEATVSRIHMLDGEGRLAKLGGGAAVECAL